MENTEQPKPLRSFNSAFSRYIKPGVSVTEGESKWKETLAGDGDDVAQVEAKPPQTEESKERKKREKGSSKAGTSKNKAEGVKKSRSKKTKNQTLIDVRDNQNMAADSLVRGEFREEAPRDCTAAENALILSGRMSIQEERPDIRPTFSGACGTLSGASSTDTILNGTGSGVCGTGSGVCGTGSGVCGTGSGVCGTGSGVCGTGSGVCGTGSGVCGTDNAVCDSDKVAVTGRYEGELPKPQPGGENSSHTPNIKQQELQALKELLPQTVYGGKSFEEVMASCKYVSKGRGNDTIVALTEAAKFLELNRILFWNDELKKLFFEFIPDDVKKFK